MGHILDWTYVLWCFRFHVFPLSSLSLHQHIQSRGTSTTLGNPRISFRMLSARTPLPLLLSCRKASKQVDDDQSISSLRLWPTRRETRLCFYVTPLASTRFLITSTSKYLHSSSFPKLLHPTSTNRAAWHLGISGCKFYGRSLTTAQGGHHTLSKAAHPPPEWSIKLGKRLTGIHFQHLNHCDRQKYLPGYLMLPVSVKEMGSVIRSREQNLRTGAPKLPRARAPSQQIREVTPGHYWVRTH